MSRSSSSGADYDAAVERAPWHRPSTADKFEGSPQVISASLKAQPVASAVASPMMEVEGIMGGSGSGWQGMGLDCGIGPYGGRKWFRWWKLFIFP